MQRLTALIDNTRATVITPHDISEAYRSCQDRFGNRFKGFEEAIDERANKTNTR